MIKQCDFIDITLVTTIEEKFYCLFHIFQLVNKNKELLILNH